MKVAHIGFPKTATTFLQGKVFPRLADEFAYIGKEACASLFAPMMDHDDTVLDRGDLLSGIECASSGSRNALFSYEALTGLHYRSAFVNRSLIARRLRELGFEKIIITIRNQFDALESAYKQYVKSGGVLKFDEYVCFDTVKQRFLYPEYFAYYPIYRLYADLFGRANVLILQYEHLGRASFIEDLAGFLQIEPFEVDIGDPINSSLSCAKTKILRVINHMTYNSYRPSHLISKSISTSFFYRQLSRLPLLNQRRSLLDPKTRGVVADFYRESNERLRKDAGVPLASSYP